jgi:AraC-like DNA-binding protein
LEHQLDWFRRQIFGQKIERFAPEAGPLCVADVNIGSSEMASNRSTLRGLAGERISRVSSKAAYESPLRTATYVGGLPRHRLKRVLDYIGDNMAADLHLAQLAAVAGMSSHYFAELFRQSTGLAPHQYVLSHRIERAKQSLQDPRISIMDAALGAGFQNSSHFARTFRRLVGTSPSRYKSETCAFAPRSDIDHIVHR